MPVKMADVSASKALFKSDFLLRCLPRDNCATAIELLLAPVSYTHLWRDADGKRRRRIGRRGRSGR